MQTFAATAPIFNADRPAALDWAPSQEVDGDRWTAIEPTADHAGIAECVADDLPGSEFTEPTPDLEEEGVSAEDRADYLAMLDAEGVLAWPASFDEYDAYADSLAARFDDREFDEANCYPPRSLCR